MTDPYEILGVDRSADVDQIKKAYKTLAKKAATLPPDQMQARMEALNNAYDSIMAMDNGKGHPAYTADSAARSGEEDRQAYGAYGAPGFADVRAMLEQNRIGEAETILDGVPAMSRTAENRVTTQTASRLSVGTASRARSISVFP